jgi:site-specific DNA-methyltransferase (adenine-specific)
MTSVAGVQLRLRDAANFGEIRERSRLTKEEWREYTRTVWHIKNVTHPLHPAPFPTEIAHRLVKLFSLYGEAVLDPFAGTGNTAQAAIPLGRRVVCIDQNADYCALISAECGTLHNGHHDLEALRVIAGDSRDLQRTANLDDGSISLVVTSPPYWNKANYGTGSDNLGNIEQYKKFLRGVRPVFAECLRVLRPGRKLCIVTANVNQHTDKGLLTFPLAADFNMILRDLGFVMVSEIIWSKDATGGKWGSFGEQRPIFGSYPYPPNFLFKNVHEYILVWAKPPDAVNRSPKALPYEWLMAEPE